MVESLGIDVARQESYETVDAPLPRESLDPSTVPIDDASSLETPPVFESKEDVSKMVQDVIGTKVGRRLGDQEIEIINAFVDMGDNDGYIAELLGRGKTTIARYSKEYESSLSFDDGNTERTDNRNKFIRKAYDLAFKILDELTKSTRIEGAKFDKLATTLGIVMDKVLLASARFESSGSEEGEGFMNQFRGMNDKTLDKFIGSTEKILGIATRRQDGKNNSRQSETDSERSES